MTKSLTSGCKNTLEKTRKRCKNCKIVRLLTQLEQKCENRRLLLSQLNNKELEISNINLLKEIDILKNLIKTN